MKRETPIRIVDKEVVIIGNGPSGIALSYMLSGHLPFITSSKHPDEMLSMRLKPCLHRYLQQDDLSHLSAGLEGRSTNPVSLLFDTLLRPNADLGMDSDSEPIAEFRSTGVQIDHIVLGKGPNGGSWHRMDPDILTLSLDTWMSLPGLPFHSHDSGEKRAYARNVAKYYQEYVHKMRLERYMQENALVTNVAHCHNHTTTSIGNDNYYNIIGEHQLHSTILGPNSFHKSDCIVSKSCLAGKSNRFSCKRQKFLSGAHHQQRHKCPQVNKKPPPPPPPPSTIVVDSECQKRHNLRYDLKDRFRNFCCTPTKVCDTSVDNNCNWNVILPSTTVDTDRIAHVDHVPCSSHCHYCLDGYNWLTEVHHLDRADISLYRSKYLVLANGAHDVPNKLMAFETKQTEPDWLLYDVRSLETHLDNNRRSPATTEIMPVLIVGAGLSAADAIIATRARNVAVIHVFRNNVLDLNKQLPENMYPEYHKVQQMMKHEGSNLELYQAFAGYTVVDIDHKSHCVILEQQPNGQRIRLTVSYMAVLIGSRPDLSFVPYNNLGIFKRLPIDCKSNTIDVDTWTHQVYGIENLFAMGPLIGDNFVRFIPGGALAITLELLKRLQ